MRELLFEEKKQSQIWPFQHFRKYSKVWETSKISEFLNCKKKPSSPLYTSPLYQLTLESNQNWRKSRHLKFENVKIEKIHKNQNFQIDDLCGNYEANFEIFGKLSKVLNSEIGQKLFITFKPFLCFTIGPSYERIRTLGAVGIWNLKI